MTRSSVDSAAAPGLAVTASAVASPDGAAQRLADFIVAHAPLLVLTGAGASTDSGIPDYRDRDGQWKRAEPMRGQVFLRDARARQRYWARSFVGWPRIAAARPNAVHRALAWLERVGLVHQLVTQNVDGLHQQGGAQRVLDLHGRLDLVDCLDCGQRIPRTRMQDLLSAANPHAVAASGAVSAPDGDVLLDATAEAAFIVPPCPRCGGLLKPAVVFFGENVPRPRVQRVFDRLDAARGLLVVGSSLTVFSGYRFCLHAATQGTPIALLNRGRTRADNLAALKLDADCATVLTRTVAELAHDGRGHLGKDRAGA